MTASRSSFIVLALALAASAGCDNAADLARKARADSVAAITADSAARARQDSINRAQPGYIIDSLLPVDEEIRRFRTAIGGQPATTLAYASTSRDSLLSRFAGALERRDTLDLRRMALTAREFIDLYYPESPYTHAPYRQSPAYLWGMTDLSGAKGLARLLQRRGGRRIGMTGLACDRVPQLQGRNRVWTRCEVIVRDGDGAERRERLFGAIIEREGRFKFMSYANGF